MKFYKFLSKVALILAIVFADYVFAKGSTVAITPLADLVIQQTEDNITKDIVRFSKNGVSDTQIEKVKQFNAPILNYLQELRGSWETTIARSPKDMPQNIRAIHETFQFYFGGRTYFEEGTVETLLTTRVPLQLDRTVFSESEWHELEVKGLQLRIAWFKLFSKLDINDILSNDTFMRSIAVATQYINDVNVNSNLDALISAEDFDNIMDSVRSTPKFSDSYIKDFAASHGAQLPKAGPFAEPESYYKGISEQFIVSVNLLYLKIWKSNPDLLVSRISALNLWIINELDYTASALSAVKEIKEGKKEIASHYSNFFENSLRGIKNAEVQHALTKCASKTSNLSDKEMVLVRELNEYLRYHGQRFDVNYVLESSKALTFLQQGDWKTYLTTKQPDDVSANLSLPIEEFADYVKSHPTEEFKADLEQIRARLEGLQDFANTMTQ